MYQGIPRQQMFSGQCHKTKTIMNNDILSGLKLTKS